jgi:L-ascorbate metabolism protein UlaG (beta-lactamase superfamily)
LISHDHFDHNHPKAVDGRKTKIFNKETDATKNGVRIKGIRAYHDESQGNKRGEVVLFKFIMGGVAFCHLGDLGHELNENTVKQLGDVDVLFVPVGNVFTIGPKQAWNVINTLKPKVAIPMHYRVGGLSLSIKPVDPFLEDAVKDSIVRVGNEMDFERDDLPENLEVWVFTF